MPSFINISFVKGSIPASVIGLPESQRIAVSGNTYSYTVPSAEPVAEDYTFQNWYVQDAGDEFQAWPGETIQLIIDSGDQTAVTFTANWEYTPDTSLKHLGKKSLKYMLQKIFGNISNVLDEVVGTGPGNTELVSIYDAIFPIGRGFIDFTDKDYSNYLGFTWERELVGMTAVGLDTTQTEFNIIGKTGGEKTHTLKINETPIHFHDIRYASSDGSGITVSTTKSGNDVLNITMFEWDKNSNNGIGSGSNLFTSNVGGGQAHNNLQPYKVVAYWKRVA